MRQIAICLGMSVVAFFYTGLRVYVRRDKDLAVGDVRVEPRQIMISVDDMNDVRAAYDATRRGCVLIAYQMLNDDEKSGIMAEVRNFIEDCAPARFFELSNMDAMGTLALHDNLNKSHNMARLGQPKMISENLLAGASVFLVVMPAHLVMSAINLVIEK